MSSGILDFGGSLRYGSATDPALERLLDELPDPDDDVLLDSLPILLYGGG